MSQHSHEHKLPHVSEALWGFLLAPVRHAFTPVVRHPSVAAWQNRRAARDWDKAQQLTQPADFFHPQWQGTQVTPAIRQRLAELARTPRGRGLLCAAALEHLETVIEQAVYAGKTHLACRTSSPLLSGGAFSSAALLLQSDKMLHRTQLLTDVLDALRQDLPNPPKQRLSFDGIQAVDTYIADTLALVQQNVTLVRQVPRADRAGVDLDLLAGQMMRLGQMAQLRGAHHDPDWLVGMTHAWERACQIWQDHPEHIRKTWQAVGISVAGLAVMGAVALNRAITPHSPPHDHDMNRPAAQVVLEMARDSAQTVDIATRAFAALSPVLYGLRRRKIPQGIAGVDVIFDASGAIWNFLTPILRLNPFEAVISAVRETAHVASDVWGAKTFTRFARRITDKVNGALEHITLLPQSWKTVGQRLSAWGGMAVSLGLSLGFSALSLFGTTAFAQWAAGLGRAIPSADTSPSTEQPVPSRDPLPQPQPTPQFQGAGYARTFNAKADYITVVATPRDQQAVSAHCVPFAAGPATGHCVAPNQIALTPQMTAEMADVVSTILNQTTQTIVITGMTDGKPSLRQQAIPAVEATVATERAEWLRRTLVTTLQLTPVEAARLKIQAAPNAGQRGVMLHTESPPTIQPLSFKGDSSEINPMHPLLFSAALQSMPRA